MMGNPQGFCNKAATLSDYEKLSDNQVVRLKALAANVDVDLLKKKANCAGCIGTYVQKLASFIELD